jgi:hypothetical protein
VGGGGKGGKGSNVGKGGKGGKGQSTPAAATPPSAEGLAAANASFLKAIGDNAAAFSVFDHEKVDGHLCVEVRDLARRLNAKGLEPIYVACNVCHESYFFITIDFITGSS